MDNFFEEDNELFKIFISCDEVESFKKNNEILSIHISQARKYLVTFTS